MTKRQNLAQDVRKHINELKAELSRVQAEIDELTDEQSQIENAPLPRADLERIACVELDRFGELFESRLEAQLLELAQKPQLAAEDDPGPIRQFGRRYKLLPLKGVHELESDGIDGFLLLGAIAPLMKEPVSRVLEGFDFSGAGLPLAERAKESEKLDKRLDELHSQRREIEAGLCELGAALGHSHEVAAPSSPYGPAFRDPGEPPRHRAVVEQRDVESATFDSPAPEPASPTAARARRGYMAGTRLSDSWASED